MRWTFSGFPGYRKGIESERYWKLKGKNLKQQCLFIKGWRESAWKDDPSYLFKLVIKCFLIPYQALIMFWHPDIRIWKYKRSITSLCPWKGIKYFILE